MRKKIKKVPKYNDGTAWADMSKGAKTGAIVDAVGTAATNVIGSIGKPVTAAGVAQGALAGAQAGMAIGGPWGAAIGAVGGGLMSSIGTGGSVDETTGEVTMPSGIAGLFGHSKSYLRRQGNLIKNSILSKQQTENLKADYYNDPNVAINPNVLAAEGAVIRRPVDALVSKGELIYDPETKQLSKVPGSKGKPNKKDDVAVKLYEGDVVVSNSPTMLMANGKTPAQNLENMVTIDKKKGNRLSEGTTKAREAIIKKVVNWQEANKTKPQEYAMYNGGGIAKYGYNKNLEEFAYWDKDKKEYKKEYLDWVNNLTEQDVKDIYEKKYGDMSTYLAKNKGRIPTLDEAKRLMTDKKYGDWHKIGKAVVDEKIKRTATPEGPKPLKAAPVVQQTIVGPRTGALMYQDLNPADYPVAWDVVGPGKLSSIPNPSEAEGRAAAKKLLNQQRTKATLNKIGEAISDYAPLVSALFGDYDYHREQAYINPAKYLPTGVSIEPLRRAADESFAMARYNQANINPNTGAGMAYGLQAAANRAKSLADAYQWQTEQQNKLIAQNVGIYNNWAAREEQARHTATTETRQNEAAADYMRRTDIKSGLNWAQQRRRDRQLLPAYKQYLQYGMYDDVLKGIQV